MSIYGRGLRGLTLATITTNTLALALVFFYAPLDADQGFVQKIFYIHVPLAIVSLCGFIAGGLFAIGHLRSGDRRWDMRAYVAALNEHRRSRTKPLTIEEKREKVDAALKADPERSDQTATARRVVRTSGGSGHFGIRRPSRIAPGLLRVTAPFC